MTESERIQALTKVRELLDAEIADAVIPRMEKLPDDTDLRVYAGVATILIREALEARLAVAEEFKTLLAEVWRQLVDERDDDDGSGTK